MSNCSESSNGTAGRLIGLLLWVGSTAFAAEPPITAGVFAPDGKSAIIGSQRGISVRSLPELQQTATLPTKLAHVHDLEFSPAGDVLAAVGGSPAESGAIELYGWPSAELIQRAIVAEDLLYQVSWRDDGEVLAVAGPDQHVLLLDRQLELQGRLTGHSRDTTTVAFLSGGYLVSGSRDQTLRVWQQPGNELVRTLNNHTREVWDVAARTVSGDSPAVVASSGEDRTVRFWWPVRGRLMRFAKLPSPALDIAWTVDGARLLAACADGHLRVVDPDSVQVVRELPIADGWLYTVAASPDGQSLFAGGAGGTMQVLPATVE